MTHPIPSSSIERDEARERDTIILKNALACQEGDAVSLHVAWDSTLNDVATVSNNLLAFVVDHVNH